MRNRKIWITVAALALTAILCTVFILRPEEEIPQRIEITPAGEPVITLEYGQSYEEPGASAMLFRGEETLEISAQTKNYVNEHKVGSYLVKYIAVHEGMTATAYRRVNVVDTAAPQITLVSDPNRVTLPDTVYEEEGFSATDNYDGDITHRVLRRQTHEKVYYTVSDASGNTTTVERWIAYDDPEPPVLTLAEGNAITAPAGATFTDPGWTAMDNCDGDITGKVSVSGSVDILTPGTYTLTYTVTDSYENTTTVTRDVTVVNQTAPEVVIPEGKTIYLTFDDGPGPYTERLLDVLKKYDVKATFFLVNTAYIGLAKRMVEEGHAVGVHTTTHDYKSIYDDDEAFLNDLYTMRGIIKDITGIETTLLRFPGGSSNTKSKKYSRGIMTRMTQKVIELGFQYFDWNVDSNDAGGAKSSQTVFNNVCEGIDGKQTAIVLQHDIKSYSVDAVERIINWGLSNGYTFRALSYNSPPCHHGIKN